MSPPIVVEADHPPAPRLLHYWARKGNFQKVHDLLNRGKADKFARDSEGHLPFHRAAKSGHVKVLQALKPANVNERSTANQRSALHYAAAFGHLPAAEWLICEQMAEVDAADMDGNTPLHFAVLLRKMDVVKLLVGNGANSCKLNNDELMPVSYCQDTEMFEALFSPEGHKDIEAMDSNKRTLLHYAAQHAHSEAIISQLLTIAEDPHLLQADIHGDTFLHVAAKAGNVEAVKALKTSGFHVDKDKLPHPSGLTPIVFALFQNHYKVYHEILEVGTVEITLETVIKGLIKELMRDSTINASISLFASTLPTYLALYAKKDLAFDIMLRMFQKIELTVNQWDDEHKRTCLHWAVVHKRKDIVQKLLKHPQVRPSIEDTDGKTAQQHAFELRDHEIMQALIERPDFKAYEEKQYRDREVYAQALNATLVGAVLIAGVTFGGWLQLPSSDFKPLSMRVFWATNSLAFFFAMGTVSVGVGAFIPTPKKYIGEIVKQVRLAIVSAATLLALTLVLVLCAFSAAGFAALPYIAHYNTNMHVTVVLGSTICGCMWLWFFSQLCKCMPSYASMLHPLLKHLPSPSSGANINISRIANHFGNSSRFGYSNTSREQLKLALTWNLANGDYQPKQESSRHSPPPFDIEEFIKSLKQNPPQDAAHNLLDIAKERKNLKKLLFEEDVA